MITPRTYIPIGEVLSHDYAVILATHPESFDCIVFPAKSSDYNEIVADNVPVGTLLDRDERAQEYDAPVQARALLVPLPELDFDATDSGSYEGFSVATDTISLLLSVPGIRKFSLVQWLEYTSLEGEETVERTVYVQDIRPMGRTLSAGMVYICNPLPALGEIPDALLPEDGTGDGEGTGEDMGNSETGETGGEGAGGDSGSEGGSETNEASDPDTGTDTDTDVDTDNTAVGTI